MVDVWTVTQSPGWQLKTTYQPQHPEYYSFLHCTMTLETQTVVVFTVIAVLVLVNVILMFLLGSR